MAGFWVRAGELLGAKFLRQYGEVGSDTFVTWCVFCRDLTPEQINFGFERAMKSDDDFLDAKKFKKFCLCGDINMPETNAAAYKLYRHEEHEKSQPGPEYRQFMKNMKETLH